MPLTSTANPVVAPERKDWKPVPEDIYQVVVSDVEEKILPKYQAQSEDDVEAYYKFKFVILDGEGEAANQMVSVFCTRKWFSGNSKAKPSKLVSLVKAIYGFYYPKLSVVELEADEMTLAVINDLIGKQLRVAVKLNTDGTNNKVTEFMAVKKELPLSEEVKVAEVAKKMLAKPTDDTKEATESTKEEQGDPNDPPF